MRKLNINKLLLASLFISFVSAPLAVNAATYCSDLGSSLTIKNGESMTCSYSYPPGGCNSSNGDVVSAERGGNGTTCTITAKSSGSASVTISNSDTSNT